MSKVSGSTFSSNHGILHSIVMCAYWARHGFAKWRDYFEKETQHMRHHPFLRSQDYLYHLNVGRLGNNLGKSQMPCQIYFRNNPILLISNTNTTKRNWMERAEVLYTNYSQVDLGSRAGWFCFCKWIIWFSSMELNLQQTAHLLSSLQLSKVHLYTTSCAYFPVVTLSIKVVCAAPGQFKIETCVKHTNTWPPDLTALFQYLIYIYRKGG